MSERKWEDLDVDCLVNIFGRLGMESLLLDVPFVCKSWYKATFNRLCWLHLDFPEMIVNIPWHDNDFISRLMDEYRVEGEFCVTSFIKSIVDRSNRAATFLSLPSCCTEEALHYVADECPKLQVLVLPQGLAHDHVPNLMRKWKDLEFLRLGSSFKMQEVLTQISIHCKNFVGLTIERASVGEEEASAIVTSLSNIKCLDLKYASMEKKNLVTILQGCKQLVDFDARYCIGFEESDEEILTLASHIKIFKHQGSVLFVDYEDSVCSSCSYDNYAYSPNYSDDNDDGPNYYSYYYSDDYHHTP